MNTQYEEHLHEMFENKIEEFDDKKMMSMLQRVLSFLPNSGKLYKYRSIDDPSFTNTYNSLNEGYIWISEASELNDDEDTVLYYNPEAECEQLKEYTFSHPDLIFRAAYRNNVTNFYFGGLPLLAPMSEVAGRLAIQTGARLLESNCGGRGILLGGVPGVERANVVIVGGGNVGINAAKIATGIGANVTVLDVNIKRLAYLDDVFGSSIQTLLSNPFNIARAVKEADLVVGCVLIPGAKAPKLVTEEMVKQMKPGSVLIDVAIDQGGSIESIDRITTHADPYFVKHGVLHYSVANMPGAVPRTSTLALTGATLPYALKIAKLGAEAACKADSALMKGLNTYNGHLTFQAVADAQGLPYTDPTTLL